MTVHALYYTCKIKINALHFAVIIKRSRTLPQWTYCHLTALPSLDVNIIVIITAG